jgi:hypothetical protein
MPVEESRKFTAAAELTPKKKDTPPWWTGLFAFRERDTASIGPGGDLRGGGGLARLAKRLPKAAPTLHPPNGTGRSFLRRHWRHSNPSVTIELPPNTKPGSQHTEVMRGLLVAMLPQAGELGSKPMRKADLGHHTG